jgi:hypothetical protein
VMTNPMPAWSSASSSFSIQPGSTRVMRPSRVAPAG